MLVGFIRPNSGEAPWTPMVLIMGMTNCYASVRQGGQRDVFVWV